MKVVVTSVSQLSWSWKLTACEKRKRLFVGLPVNESVYDILFFFYYWLFEIWKHVCHASFSKYQSFLFLFEMKLSQSFNKLEPVDSKCPTRENRWHETSPANGRFCIKQNTLRWHYQRKWWSTLSYAYYARESVNDTDFGTCNVQVLTTFTFVISNVVAFEQQLINRQFSFQKPAYFSVMTINLSVIRLIERFTTLWAAIAWRTQKDTHTQKKERNRWGEIPQM